MKKIILLLIIFATGLFSQDNKNTVIKSSVEEIVFYPNEALVKRTAFSSIKKGFQTIRVRGISKGIRKNSVKISGQNKAFTIISSSFNHNYNYLEESGDALKIKDEIKMQQAVVNALNIKKQSKAEVKNYLSQNRKITESTLMNPNLFASLTRNYAQLWEQNSLELLKINDKLVVENKKLFDLKNKLTGLGGSENEPTTELVLKISSKENISGKLSISYLVNNAYWKPRYELQIPDFGTKAELNQKAIVYQNTGEKWENTKVTLSSTRPSTITNIPTLYPNYLRNQNDNRRKMMKYSKSAEVMMEADAMPSPVIRTVRNDDFYGIDYKLGSTHTVNSSKEMQILDIDEFSINLNYKHYSIPKLSSSVYLVAIWKGWEKLKLTNAPIFIYHKNNLVSKTNFSSSVDNEIIIPLGVEQSVKIKRTKLNDFKSNKVFGTKIEKQFAFEIHVKNNKSKKISIDIYDQIPISQDKKISVKDVELDGAELNKVNGKLKWNLNIRPYDSKKIKFSYKVSHPEKYRVLNR